jgi:GDP-L-fucose synthase
MQFDPMSTVFNKILVTGAPGFLGHHIVPVLRAAFPAAAVVPVGRQAYELLEPAAVARMFRDIQPDCVVHLAGKSGGIVDNRQRPADYFYNNLAMNTTVLHEAWRAGVKKVLSLMGGCSYPATAASPIGESQMWNGFPQIDSAGYSVAKKMLLVQSWAYRQQHGFNSVVLVPGNLYGEWDNFNLTQAHVIPALLRKYLEAEERGQAEIVAFGTGRPTRDFVYAGDVAATIPWFLQNYDSSEPVNISSGTRITIRELAETIKAVTGFQGQIRWDTTQTDGQMDKIYDVTKLHALGLNCPTPLRVGLEKTLAWFLRARAEGTVRL